MEVAKYSPISLLAELNVAMYGSRGTSPTLFPAERPSTNTERAPWQRSIVSHVPSLLVAANRSIKNPTPKAGIILAPNCNNQICAAVTIYASQVCKENDVNIMF